MIKKEQVLEVLGENTDWYENQCEDLIHVGKFDSIAESIVKLCNLQIVTQQREPFIDFIKWLYSDITNNLKCDTLDEIVDNYLKSINGG